MAVREDSNGFLKHLENWGLDVSAEKGWRSRGRPYNFYPRGVVCHHTASPRRGGDMPSLNTVVHGRSDLPGPLCHVLLGRSGKVKVIAMGDANHAGSGGPKLGIPANEANYFMWGIEAENDGVGEPWPEHQMDAYAKLCAALLTWINVHDAKMVIGHKEWTSRKIDPDFNMRAFRRRVKKVLKAGPSKGVTVHLSKLKFGKRNKDVLAVKRALKARGFFKGSLIKFFGPGLRNSYKRWQRHLGYSGKDADGIPGESSLQALGFIVKK